MDRNGRVLVRDLLPRDGVPAAVRGVLDGCPVGGGEGAATMDEGWGEPGLTPAEKIYGWNSLIVLAMVSGRPENPVNAVAPDARAHCQPRYTVDTDPAGFEDAVRRHLDAQESCLVNPNCSARGPEARRMDGAAASSDAAGSLPRPSFNKPARGFRISCELLWLLSARRIGHVPAAPGFAQR